MDNTGSGSVDLCDGTALLSGADVQLMQALAQQIAGSHLELVNSDASYGELAWNFGRGRLGEGRSWLRRLWFDTDSGGGGDNGDGTGGGNLIAWGWAALPRKVTRADGTVRDVTDAYLTYQVHPDHSALIDEVAAWYESVAPGVRRTLLAQTADETALARWAAHGYHPDPDAAGDDGDWTQLNVRDLDVVETPVLPDGYRFRTAADAGPHAAVQAHGAAWPGSTMTLAAFENLQATPGYRADLHFLVEAPDGTMAASAIMWLDQVNRSVEFEPVGTHPEHRRRGLSRAMLLHGMHTARAAGAVHATVACLGAPGHPTARQLYYSLGFRYFSRDVPLVKAAG